MTGQEQEALTEALNEAIGHLRVAALAGDEIPAVVEVGFGFERKPVRHLLRRELLGAQTGTTSRFHLLGELPQGGFGERAAFAAGVCGAGRVNRSKQLLSPAL